MVKKISQIALVKLNAKGDYKSNSAIKFTEAYSKTFDMVTRALTQFNLQTPECFEGFTSLYYPAEKVLASAKNKELAKSLNKLKKGTSIRQV